MKARRYMPFAHRILRREGPPVHLTVFVTGACNLRCRHCFHWREVADGVPGPTLDELRALADSAAVMGPLLWVSFAGGEPFLRRDLPDLARAFGRHGLRHLAIPTNGLVARQNELVERVLRENPELFLSVSVSIDGPEQIHDAIRAVEGGHRRALESLRGLQGLQGEHGNLGLGLILTVTKENQDELAAHLVELVDELRPDNVTINLARSDALDRELLEVDPARYREVVATKERLVREGRLKTFGYPMARLGLARDRLMYEHVERIARGDRSRHLDCTAGSLSAVVFEDGTVRPCEVLDEDFGNLADVGWDLGALWNAERALAVRRQIRATRCACTWECAQADNVLFRARSWPGLLKKAFAT